jgi:hypothetical protein
MSAIPADLTKVHEVLALTRQLLTSEGLPTPREVDRWNLLLNSVSGDWPIPLQQDLFQAVRADLTQLRSELPRLTEWQRACGLLTILVLERRLAGVFSPEDFERWEVPSEQLPSQALVELLQGLPRWAWSKREHQTVTEALMRAIQRHTPGIADAAGLTGSEPSAWRSWERWAAIGLPCFGMIVFVIGLVKFFNR